MRLRALPVVMSRSAPSSVAAKAVTRGPPAEPPGRPVAAGPPGRPVAAGPPERSRRSAGAWRSAQCATRSSRTATTLFDEPGAEGSSAVRHVERLDLVPGGAPDAAPGQRGHPTVADASSIASEHVFDPTTGRRQGRGSALGCEELPSAVGGCPRWDSNPHWEVFKTPSSAVGIRGPSCRAAFAVHPGGRRSAGKPEPTRNHPPEERRRDELRRPAPARARGRHRSSAR